MPKLRHYDNEGTARFVTFGCYRNLPFLTNELAYVIMPEHVHLVLHPPDGMPLGLVVRERGVVSEPGEWLWSNYNCYHGVDDVPLVIDKYEM